MNQFNKFRDFVHGNLSPVSRNERQLIAEVVKEEKHVDNIKAVLTTAEKKLSNSLYNPKGSEQKTKKMPSASLNKFFNEASETLSTTKSDSVLSKTLLTCSQLQNEFTNILSEHETDVEQKCLAPIDKYLVEDLPSIHRAKKQFNKAMEERKAARAKYDSITKSASQSGQLNSIDMKLEPVKKEVEYCEQKLEQCRDTYEIEMFAFLGKELEVSEIFLQYIKSLEVYHERMLNQIRHYIPVLEGVLQNSTQKPVFGVTLDEHLRSTGRRLSVVIEKCVEYLAPFVCEEGLFRISGSLSKMKRIRNAFNAGRLEAINELKNDAAALVSTLKSYLRELPEPLLTFQLYNQWADAAKIPEQNERLQAIWSVCNQLPEANRDNLCYLLNFLHALTLHSEQNKMSSQNLAIALGPSLLWNADEPYDLSISNHLPVIVEALITYFDYFFPNAPELVPECNKVNKVIEQTLKGDNHPVTFVPDDRIMGTSGVGQQSPKATSHHHHSNKNGGSNGKKHPAPKPPGQSLVSQSQSPTPAIQAQPNGPESPSGQLISFGNPIRVKSKIGSFKFKKPGSFESSNNKNGPVAATPIKPQPPPRPDSPSGQIYLRKSPTPNSETRTVTPRPRSVCERPSVAPPSIPPRPSLNSAKTDNHNPPTNTTALNDSDLNAELNHIDSDSESLSSIRIGDVKAPHQKIEIRLEEEKEADDEPEADTRMYPLESVEDHKDTPIISDSGGDSLSSNADTPPPQKPPRMHSSSSRSSSNHSLNNLPQNQHSVTNHQPPPSEMKKQHQRSESLPDNNPNLSGGATDGGTNELTKERSESSASGSVVAGAADINQTYL